MSRLARVGLAATALVLLLPVACDDDDTTVTNVVVVPPPGPTTPTVVQPGQDPPGIVIEILGVGGASGTDGSFQVGDRPKVTYRIEKRDGTSWTLADFPTGRIMLSGPSFNYQRVIPERQDLMAGSVRNADGSFTYTFADGIPAIYAAPINDSPAFGPDDGELTGQDLLAGTYTIGMYVGWNYTVEGESFRDADDATVDVRFAGASDVDVREVVGQDNCNQCHVSLSAHGGLRRDVKLCVLCHTTGAEDKNVATVAGGTPGASIDFRVMIHRIHGGAHLPSVNGVATRSDGLRDYAAPPTPYVLVGGSSNRVHDFSGVAFPIWPEGQSAMPRDLGYTALAAADKAKEDTIRTGAVHCAACHGDPDGGGPVQAPAQGDLVHAQPTRRACGSCHDDVDWTRPYTSNGSTMPAQAHDGSCILCHVGQGNSIDSAFAHVHPLRNPALNAGLRTTVTAVAEAGVHDGDGRIDPGEKVAVTFSLADDSGAPVLPGSVASLSVVFAGPTANHNLVLSSGIPLGAMSGASTRTVRLPQAIQLELVGTSTVAANDVFTTSRFPHWDMTGAATAVLVRTATTGGSTFLLEAVPARQNWIDVSNPAGFARNEFIVLDDGVAGLVEYLQVQSVIGNRIWFVSSATSSVKNGPALAHGAGATVREVTLTTKVRNTHYSLDAATGSITELQDFGPDTDVLVGYTADFVMPATYPLAINDTPTLDDASGKWTGKPIASGTYAITVWGSRDVVVALHGETQTYRSTSEGSRFEFLVGDATTLEPYDLISSGDNCKSCHSDVMFHGGGRRGFDTCLACHGTAGSEDRPQYVAPNAPATDATTISFRTMLHRIHMGAALEHPSSYVLVGFGSGAYPNNYSAHTYEHVAFPALPGGAGQCVKCHGEDNDAWLLPRDRNHPTAQVRPVQTWRAVCASCHDGDHAKAHIEVQTAPNGQESCAVCHGENRDWHVRLMHKVR